MKRLIDVLVAAFILLLLAPVLVVVALLIRRYLGMPILFRQERAGLCASPMQMVKFRTMSNGMDSNGRSLSDSERQTRLGDILRATSLDELPGFWNVLKGDMTLVGPRPLLMQYLPLYTPEQARRHEVRPGITGWAQVNGRNAISWDEKFAHDVWYVDNRTLWLDVKILLLTIVKVFTRDGVTTTGGGTMPTFRGSSEDTRRDEKQ